MLSLYTALYSITNYIVFIICFVLFSKIYLDQLLCFCTYCEWGNDGSEKTVAMRSLVRILAAYGR